MKRTYVQSDHINESYWEVLSFLFILVHKVVLTFESVDDYDVNDSNESLTIQNVTIQMKPTEQCFPVVLFVMLYNVVVTFESVDEILKCDHSNLTAIDTWNKTHVIWRTFYNLERPLHLHRWKPLILSKRQVFISSGGGLPRSLTKSDFTVQVACRETINPLHLELFELNYTWKWKTMCLNQKSVLWILYT